MVHPDPAARDGARAGGRGRPDVGELRHARRHDERRPPRQGAGDDLASAASDRLHDRRHRDQPRGEPQIRGHRILGQRVRDFTRIAASDPVMWRDIFLNNREAVLEIVQRFTEDLTALQRAIRWGEGDKLQELFTRTRAIRRSIIEAKQA